MITSIVVDDEKNSRENLRILLEDFCEGIEVVGTAGTVAEAQNLIEKHNPNVVFLDIQMSNETGFDLLEKYEQVHFEVLFITAYSEYALQAIKFSAIDYILKPIDIDELQTAVEKVKNKVDANSLFHENIQVLLQNLNTSSDKNNKLAIPTNDGMVFLKLKDIFYFEGKTNHTLVHTRFNENHLANKTLKEYESILSDHNFLRIHKSFLINMDEIKEYMQGDEGYVVMKNNDKLIVSEGKRSLFENKNAGSNLN